ncbi:MAG: hypothetical protein JWO31_2007, partial [Phycisphaerales bacterium]|nr:hypothetical protein [Phycisphaerales bacterium]
MAFRASREHLGQYNSPHGLRFGQSW